MSGLRGAHPDQFSLSQLIVKPIVRQQVQILDMEPFKRVFEGTSQRLPVQSISLANGVFGHSGPVECPQERRRDLSWLRGGQGHDAAIIPRIPSLGRETPDDCGEWGPRSRSYPILLVLLIVLGLESASPQG